MNCDVEQLAQRLQQELHGSAVTREPGALASHGVDGMRPALICAPGTPEEVAAALRVCSEAQAAVIPWGGGSAMAIGNPPRAADVVMETTGLSRVIEHDHANLTASVQSGVTVAALQEILGRQNQSLPIDPPHAARATVGGVVAANLNGPRRSSCGSVRDLVIGMKVALASGEEIKAGGKVVKNVAGYDMCKLFVGSLGSLGIITEVTLRMAPIPEAAATLSAAGSRPKILKLAEEIGRSALLPAAIFLLNRQAGELSETAPDEWRIAVWTEGFDETVGRHLGDAKMMAESLSLDARILREADHRRFWRPVGDFPLNPDRLVYRVTLPRAALNETIDRIESREQAGHRPAWVADVATGSLWISLPPDAAGLAAFGDLIAAAERARGYAVLLSAPPSLKAGLDVWGPAPPTLSLMRGIKNQFDPKGLLNPGRFIAGI